MNIDEPTQLFLWTRRIVVLAVIFTLFSYLEKHAPPRMVYAAASNQLTMPQPFAYQDITKMPATEIVDWSPLLKQCGFRVHVTISEMHENHSIERLSGTLIDQSGQEVFIAKSNYGRLVHQEQEVITMLYKRRWEWNKSLTMTNPKERAALQKIVAQGTINDFVNGLLPASAISYLDSELRVAVAEIIRQNLTTQNSGRLKV